MKIKLLPKQGDIILAHNYGIFGWYVRLITKSYWNHCLLYLGNGEVLDILGRGITKLNYNKYYKNKIEHKFLRVKRITDYERKQVCNHALTFQEQGYNIGLVLGLKNNIKAFTCSQFINKIFADKGIILCKESLTVAPVDIDNSIFTYELDNPPNRQKKLQKLVEMIKYDMVIYNFTEKEIVDLIKKDKS